MKKVLLLSVALTAAASVSLCAQSAPEDSESADWPPAGKRIFLGGGIGVPTDGKIAINVDFRYWYVGLTIGIVENEVLPEYSPEAVPQGNVSRVDYDLGYLGVDLNAYYDIGRWSFFGSVGYYVDNKTWLYRSDATGSYYEGGTAETEKELIGVGGGAWYTVLKGDADILVGSLELGASLHSVRGLSAGFGATLGWW